MSAENKALVRRGIEEVWNERNMSAINEIFADNYTAHDPNTPDMGRGPESVRKTVDHYLAAFPDTRFTIDEIIAEGDRVVTRWTVRATHRGELQGLAPTNKPVTVTGITISRCENGRIVEGFLQWDSLGMMQQLGALSKLASTGAKAARR